MLLTNDLINIYGEISKIRLILWIVYTCYVKANVKGQREIEKWVEMNVLCIVDQDHQR